MKADLMEQMFFVINSLQIEEVPFLPYMGRPANTKAGCRHRCTHAVMRYFRSEVVKMLIYSWKFSSLNVSLAGLPFKSQVTAEYGTGSRLD